MSEITDAFVEYMQDQTEFPAPFLLDVVNLLKAVNQPVEQSDHWLLGFAVRQVEQEIKNACNVLAVPAGLYPYAVRLIVVEYLMTKKGMGLLQGLSLLLRCVVQCTSPMTTGSYMVVPLIRYSFTGFKASPHFLSSAS